MSVLGIDTATHASSAALLLGGAEPLERRDDPSPRGQPGHATRLLTLAHELLAQAGVRWDELRRIAVGVGPGGFTGLRVGIATARGLAQSLGCEIVGVSSADALAHRAAADERLAGSGLLAVIDARRGEVFLAAYRAASPPAGEEGATAAALRITEPRALAPQAFAAELEQACSLAPDLDRFVAVGDGAVRYRGALEALGVTVPPDPSPLHRVSAAAVCVLGARQTAQPLEAVLPDYRRRPDAELALERHAPAGASHG